MSALYRLLLRLHPKGFREQFGAQMTLIQEESGGGFWLLADAFVSLLRQWIVRGPVWRIVPIVLLAALSMLLVTLVIAPASYPAQPPAVSGITRRDLYVLAVFVSLVTSGGTILASLSWRLIRRPLSRRRRA